MRMINWVACIICVILGFIDLLYCRFDLAIINFALAGLNLWCSTLPPIKKD